MRVLVLAILATGGVLFAPSVASAHAMKVNVEPRGESVYLLAYFDDETPAESATVSVTDANGTEVLTGTTNERGEWTFAKPAPGTYKVTVKGVGHVSRRELIVEGEADSQVVVTPSWQLSKTAGIAIGLGLLLGISAISWFISRSRRG
jgi:hypothetical protein